MRGRYAATAISGTIALIVGMVAAGSAADLPNHRVTRTEIPGGVQLTAEPTEQSPNTPEQGFDGSTFTFTKSVRTHQVPVDETVTYVHSITNNGPGTVTDLLENDSDIVSGAVADGRLSFVDFEFIDVPTGASATLLFDFDPTAPTFVLIASVTPLGPGETFSWKVTFHVNGPVGATVSNQSTLQENCPGLPCTTPVVQVSDDPDVPGSADPTVIVFVSPVLAPALGPVALAASSAGLVWLGSRRLRRRRSVRR
jgi:hypothetical protein